MLQKIEMFLEQIGNLTREEYFGKYGKIEQFLRELEIQYLPKVENIAVIEKISNRITKELSLYPVWMQVHMLSYCMKLTEEKIYAERLMQLILDADYDDIGEYGKLNLYWQMSVSVFSNARLQSNIVKKGEVGLYRTLFEAFSGALQLGQYSYIPVEKRNKDVVFVFTSQLLGEHHAPTKTLWDRCRVLKEHLNKHVVVINTAMQMAEKGAMPFYEMAFPAYRKEYSGLDRLNLQGEVYDFYQCSNCMPDLKIISDLQQFVWKMKPYCIFNIGGSDLCADLCGRIVPEITISTVFSDIATTCGLFQVVCKDLTEVDYECLAMMGCKKENVKKSLFTFTFREQDHSFTREELGFAEGKKILLITGWRLDDEADDVFLKMLDVLSLKVPEIEVVFMGKFDRYEEKCRAFTGLWENSIYLGMQEDALSIIECCDLYVNPKRSGGGSSAAEALFKGLPLVTLPTGDVAAAAGVDFHVKDYEEMAEKIQSYCMNQELYQQMSQKAKKRATALMDSRKSFCDVFFEIENSPDFQ